MSKTQSLMILALIAASAYALHEAVTCEESIVHFKGYKCLDTGANYYISNPNSITFRITDATGEETYLLKVKSKLSYTNLKEKIELLGRCQGLSNVMQVIDSYEDNEHYMIITNFGKKGTLSDYVEKTGFKNATKALEMFEKIVKGIANIHSKGIVHGNINISHIVIDAADEPYIIDFSTAVEEGEKQTVTGDILFMSNELLNNMLSVNQKYTKAVDIYSAAVVLYYMMYKKLPYYSTNFEDIIEFQRMGVFAVYPNSIKEYVNLMRKRLGNNPDERGSAYELWLEIQRTMEGDKTVIPYGSYIDLNGEARGELSMANSRWLMWHAIALIVIWGVSYGLFHAFRLRKNDETNVSTELTIGHKIRY